MEGKLSELYLRDTYLNKNIDLLVNQTIIEYDLKTANVNLCREYNLLPKDRIDKIANMPREDRVTTIGKLMRKDSKFKEGLKAAFVDIRRRFFEANEICDGDILAVRKDAIFCLRVVDETKFGYCTFVPKNRYSSFMRLGQLELYYGPNEEEFDEYKVDVKGIKDTVVAKHEGFMLDFFKGLFGTLEVGTRISQVRYVRRFIDRYKQLQLPVGYYREFNQDSIIRLKGETETYDNEVFIPYEDKTSVLDIDYNYSNILLPIVKILL